MSVQSCNINKNCVGKGDYRETQRRMDRSEREPEEMKPRYRIKDTSVCMHNGKCKLCSLADVLGRVLSRTVFVSTVKNKAQNTSYPCTSSLSTI